MSEKSKRNLHIAVAVILLILIILFYFLTLGKINYLAEESQDKRRINWIDERLKYLTLEINSKTELKVQLDFKVKRYFLYTRIVLLSFVLLLNLGWYLIFENFSVCSPNSNEIVTKTKIIDTISWMLDFNQMLLLLLFAILFIKFDTLKEINDVMRLIHLSVKRFVYKKHKGLENEIKVINFEVEILEQERKKIEIKISENKVP